MSNIQVRRKIRMKKEDREVIYELIVYIAIIIVFLIFLGIGIYIFMYYLNGKSGV